MLVVSEEPSRTELVRMALRYEGWVVRAEDEARGAMRCVREWQPDALVLDVTSGVEGCASVRVRQQVPEVPALFLARRGADVGPIPGVRVAGDAWVAEPFGVDEVVAGLRVLLRPDGTPRERPPQAGALLVVGDLELDEECRVVSRGGEGIRLTDTEFELLRYLMRNPRRVLSKAQILSRVWNHDVGRQANLVELYISYLRRKLDAGRAPMIHTRRGEGYVLRPAEPVQPPAGSSGPSGQSARRGGRVRAVG